MAVERQVISASIKKVKVKEYLAKELEKAGIGDIDIQRTPMDTRVIIHAQRPGIVIGKKGTTIKNLTQTLRDEYGMDNPQIEVNDIGNPALSAPVMARNIASSLERGFHFRRAAYSALRDIMSAGAIGVQITLSGKLTGERSRMEKFMDGYIKHCGEPAGRLVKVGFAEASPKLGRIGVKVKILPPGAKMPDNITIASEPVKVPEKIEPELPKEKAAVPEPAEKAKAPKEAASKKVTPKKEKSPVKETEGSKAKKVKAAKKKPEEKKLAEKKKEKEAAQEDILSGTAKEVLKKIRGLDKKQLGILLEIESQGKKRKTVISEIKKLIPEEK